MKILIALQQLSGDGVSRFNLDLGAQLAALGARVRLFVYRTADSVPVPHEGPQIPVVRGQIEGLRRRYWAPVLSARLLTAVAMADVVLGGQEGGEGVAAAFMAATMTHTPMAISVQCNVIESLAISGGWTLPILRYAYPRFDRVVCVSSGVADTVAEMGVPSDRVRVIPNGADLGRVRGLAAEEPPDWLPDRPFLVSMGRLEPQKGYDTLIRAYSRARQAGITEALVILGEGGQRDALDRLATDLGLAGHVLMPGYQENPFPIVRRASAYCLSSRFEGSPLVLAEALTLGRPVIATDCVSGPRDVLADGEFGRLVQPDSVAELANALLEHAREPALLARKAAVASARAERFSVQASAGAYMRELSVLARRSTDGGPPAAPAPPE